MIISNKEKFITTDLVYIECDFKFSSKCKNKYYKSYRNVLKGRANNDGKDRCCYCFNSLTKTGSNNFKYKYNKNDSYFESIDSELKAYLLGWVAGDGHIKKDGLYLSIHPIDIDILKLFKEAISSDAPIIYNQRDNTVQWKVNSVKIANDLINKLELNCFGKKFDKISIPPIKEDLIWPFMRGLFDSDGSVASLSAKNTSPICSITSVSIDMQNDIIDLLVANNIKYTKSEKYPQIMMSGYNCNKFLDKIYQDANFYLHRKRTLWKIWKTWVPYHGTLFKPKKIRKYYPPISEEHKNKIRESNRKRKKICQD